MTHHKAISRDMWGRSADSLALVDAARARGVDVTIDQYPLHRLADRDHGGGAAVGAGGRNAGADHAAAGPGDAPAHPRGDRLPHRARPRRRRPGEHRHRPVRVGPVAGGQEPRRHPRRTGDRGDRGRRRRPGHGDRRARRRPGHLPRHGRARCRAHHAAPGYRHRLGRRRLGLRGQRAPPARVRHVRPRARPLRARARRPDARAGGAQDERRHRPPARPAGPRACFARASSPTSPSSIRIA